MRKIKFMAFGALTTLFTFVGINVNAATVSCNGEQVAQVGDNKCYSSIKDAVDEVSGDVETEIVLKKPVTDPDKVTIDSNKKIVINLGGQTVLSNTAKVLFEVAGGTLEFKGEGTIKFQNPSNNFIINALEGDTATKLTIGSEVKVLNGTVGVGAPVLPKTTAKDVTVDIYGKMDGAQTAITVNGKYKDKENYPVINIKPGAEIKSANAAIYQAGYSEINVEGATVTGGTAFIVKSGKLNLKNVNAESHEPASYAKINPTIKGDGYDGVGAVIQVESNDSYAGDVEITVDGGTYESKTNVVFLETGNKDTTSVKNLEIKDGDFKAGTGADAASWAKKEIFHTTEAFDNTIKNFISGGTYSVSVKKYLAAGLEEGSSENGFKVGEPKTNTNTNTNNNNNTTTKPANKDEENPNTYDNIISYVIIALIGTVAITLGLTRKKAYNK